ncbi:daunorubicin C-13 ketoreductase [Halobiforma lacisalsi AJ5]|uniref:Daunorubicin C-13 ketoreductase n=1 Tax=Natronobacterium lacisalsi AJ5 TaxID=358396 RepID=M0L329_NATLA|nr:SDR family NAD(P)-dependent oxidoreductase [Halobiforma lacisalsi]APW98372.1 daunorubicin C-13 ketoreductase [Halobiforma lacisalsi AJ5]EMA27977.1 oxidoreductase (short-chain dehydrogenase family) protein [Halobiforma lacisalsi AJ5]
MNDRPEGLAGVGHVNCSGQTALITGSTNGIGRAAALALGRLGADVVVHGRDVDAGESVVDELETIGAEATFVPADFTDIDAVRELARTVREETDGLDYLFNNAGGYFRTGRLTDQGVEYTFHINHIAPYQLTADLIDHLTDDACIVTTSSAAHRGVSLDLDRVETVESYSSMRAYSHSKLANILFSRELARRVAAQGRSIRSNSVHPGAIPGTDFSRFLPRPLPALVSALDVVPGITSVADGAAELLYAALSPEATAVTGQYFAKQSTRTPSRAARNDDAARRLWERSATLLDIDEPLAEVGESVNPPSE